MSNDDLNAFLDAIPMEEDKKAIEVLITTQKLLRREIDTYISGKSTISTYVELASNHLMTLEKIEALEEEEFITKKEAEELINKADLARRIYLLNLRK